MNISFNELDIKNTNSFINIQNSGTRGTDIDNQSKSISAVKIGSNLLNNNAYKNNGKTANDVLENADILSMGMEAQRDYLTVMSNCVSDEDLAKMQKDGFNPGSMSIEDTVTILDQVKTAVMKGGTNVVGYTDSVSEEALTEIAGSKTYANELKKQFEAKDIPLTEDIAKEIRDNYDTLEQIGTISESSKKYMVENDMLPSVENIYTATFASGNTATTQGYGYYAQGDVAGYYAKKPETIDMDGLMPQIEGFLKEAGYENTDENIEAARWLITKGIPLNKDTYSKYHKINEVTLPMDYKEFIGHATDAILDGVKVKKADLSRKVSMRREAFDINNEVQTLGTIKGRRVLEEVRLSMTVEANFKLLKSGYAIDTAPMEELVKNLKEIEKEFAINLTQDDNEIEAVRKKNIFTDTIDLVGAIKTGPISISLSYEASDSLALVGEKSVNLSKEYAKANDSYEALMTAPRADMGDSIKTAFRNVDDILTDLGIATTEENRRAVRILGYNSMDIDTDNIEKISEKDRLLTQTLEQLTPGRVLNMIRSNNNPLMMSVEQLNEYLLSQDSIKEDIMSYSKFLYKLEKADDISKEEREAYIGIYRLVNQIKKSDFSSIGAIENANMEFNFENILSTLRSRKHKSMDYIVDDKFGGMDAVDKGIASITTQIAKGFVRDIRDLQEVIDDIGSREAYEEAQKEELERIKEAYAIESDVINQLKYMNTPVSAENISDMAMMMNTPEKVFKQLREIGYKKNFDIKLDSKKVAKESFDKFTGSVKDFINEKIFGNNEDVMSLRSMDIRQLGQIYQHMDFLNNQSKEENYEIPVSINGELTAINLKVIHSDINSEVAISFESNTFGKVAAQFNVNDKGLSGYLSSSNKEGALLLKNNKAELINSLEANGVSINDIHFIENNSIDLKDFNNKVIQDRKADTDVISTDELYKVAKSFIGFIESFAL